MSDSIIIEKSIADGSETGSNWYPVGTFQILDTCEYISVQNVPLESPNIWYKFTSPCGIRFVGPRTNTATINITNIIIPPPEGLSITQDSSLSKQLQLSWNYSGYPEDAEGCYIFRSENSNSNFSLYATIPDTVTVSLLDTNVNYNNEYYYKIQYFSSSFLSTPSNTVNSVVESIQVYSYYTTYLNNGLVDFGSNIGRILYFHNVGNENVLLVSATISGSQFEIVGESLPVIINTRNPTWETEIDVNAINGSGVPDSGSLIVTITGSASPYTHSYILNLAYFDPVII